MAATVFNMAEDLFINKHILDMISTKRTNGCYGMVPVSYQCSVIHPGRLFMPFWPISPTVSHALC